MWELSSSMSFSLTTLENHGSYPPFALETPLFFQAQSYGLGNPLVQGSGQSLGRTMDPQALLDPQELQESMEVQEQLVKRDQPDPARQAQQVPLEQLEKFDTESPTPQEATCGAS